MCDNKKQVTEVDKRCPNKSFKYMAMVGVNYFFILNQIETNRCHMKFST